MAKEPDSSRTSRTTGGRRVEKQAVVTDTDIDVLAAFIVKGPMDLRGVVSMAALYCGYTGFCADCGATPLDLNTFAETVGRLTEKLLASRRVH